MNKKLERLNYDRIRKAGIIAQLSFLKDIFCMNAWADEQFELEDGCFVGLGMTEEVRTYKSMNITSTSNLCDYLERLAEEMTVYPVEIYEYLFGLDGCKFYTGIDFWNEVPNPEIIDYFFSIYAKMVGVETEGEANYIVSIYDMNDSEIYFANQKDLENFINTVDCAPCVVFERNGLGFSEMYCI